MFFPNILFKVWKVENLGVKWIFLKYLCVFFPVDNDFLYMHAIFSLSCLSTFFFTLKPMIFLEIV